MFEASAGVVTAMLPSSAEPVPSVNGAAVRVRGGGPPAIAAMTRWSPEGGEIAGPDLPSSVADPEPDPLPIEQAALRALRHGELGNPPRHAAPDLGEPVERADAETTLAPLDRADPDTAKASAPRWTVDAVHHAFGAAVRAAAGHPDPTVLAVPVDVVDVGEVVNTAVGMCVSGDGDAAMEVARRSGEVVAAMTELRLPEAAMQPVDWSGFGALIPVLAGSAGAGASVLAAALTDALQNASRCALLVDAADPARSGLVDAATAQGPWTHQPHRELAVRWSWRGHALLARLESTLPMVTPGMVPPPPAWLPELDPLHVTVVDIGHDGWRAAANPLVGAGGWMRRGTPAQRPLLVVRPTRPSLQQAEQVLGRLDPWVTAGVATSPFSLVVMGARHWPSGVVDAAGHRLAPLINDALFIPHDPDVEANGVTGEPVPDRVLEAVLPLLVEWGLVHAVRPSTPIRPRT